MTECPEGFLYSTRHMWVKLDQEQFTALIGMAEDLTERLSTIVSVDLPMIGDELEIDTDCLHLHLENGIKPLYAPLSGRVVEINRYVLDEPASIPLAPYENYLFVMEYDESSELDLLLSPTRYAIYLDEIEGP